MLFLKDSKGYVTKRIQFNNYARITEVFPLIYRSNEIFVFEMISVLSSFGMMEQKVLLAFIQICHQTLTYIFGTV